MSKDVCCPTPTAIPSAVKTLNPCEADFGQVQKLVFWRAGNSMSLASALTSTAWTALLAATGDTKAVVTPYVSNVEWPPSEPREFGGGNETLNGAPIRKGNNSTQVSMVMYMEDQDVITTLKQWSCENLEVIPINESGQFGYSDTNDFSGFPISKKSLSISDKGIGGMIDPDTNNLTFNLKPNWSNTFEISAETSFALDMVNA
jgi:hypothetical protein